VGTYMTAKTKMTVGTKLKFLMIFLVITLLVTAGISFFTSHKFANQIDDLGKVQMPGSTHMNLADMMHDGIRANVYSAIIAAHSTNEDEKKAVREEAKEFHESIRSHINELEKLNLHPETKAAITPALPRIEEYVKSANELVEVSLSGDEVKARTMLPSFNEKFEALEKELATLGELIEADVAESTEHGEAIEKEAKVYNLISLGIGICLMVFFFLVVREQQNELASIVHSLMSESNKINDIAGGMTSSAQNLASATQEQASAFQESAAALEEISATIKTTELNSRRLDESSKSSYESASNGKVTIEQMLNAMDVIRSSNASMATQIEESNKRINDIVSVISEIEDKTKVINDIVFQTKLLSFNASVEAARAGEQGKGFAVVASEVDGVLALPGGNAAITQRLYEKLNLHPETKAAITPALPRIEEYVKSANELVEVSLSGDEVKARTMLPSFNEKFEALEKELATLGELIEADVAESTEHGEAIEKEAKVYNLISLGIGICLMVFFFLVVREQQNELASIVHSLMSESNKINDIAGGMTSSAQNLASATQEQASAFQESAAALEEISATIKTTELNSRRLDESSKSSYESASNGKVTIEQMLNAMDVIRSSNASMATQIEESNKRINDIVSVISEIEDKTKVINDIVFQTKLLSFNASVEAARAGEQGKGFAVVAEEVGNLATMSGNAAKEISELLSNSIQTVHAIVNESKSKVERMTVEGKTKVEQGISIANKCGSALEEIVQQTSTVGGLISEITTAVKEQATGITEVSNAMALLDQASARNSMTSNENLQASQALQVQVHKLEEVVGSLSAMMTSKKAG
jgi:methyl-accepting chemotaxis protein